jgi:hypothetical protein
MEFLNDSRLVSPQQQLRPIAKRSKERFEFGFDFVFCGGLVLFLYLLVENLFHVCRTSRCRSRFVFGSTHWTFWQYCEAGWPEDSTTLTDEETNTQNSVIFFLGGGAQIRVKKLVSSTSTTKV